MHWIAGVGYSLHGRTDNAILTDRAKKAPVTRDARKWASKPNRLDLGGIDRPEAKDHHLEARIDTYWQTLTNVLEGEAAEALKAQKTC